MERFNSRVGRPRERLFLSVSGRISAYSSEPISSACWFSGCFLAIMPEEEISDATTRNILDQWLGGSEAVIRTIFARARAAAPCILFFDELDAIATNREDDDGGSSDVHSRLLSTLLNELDSVNSDNSKSGVLIVGTTTRIKAIDAALLRPGRFEEHIHLDIPTLADVEILLNKFMKKVPMGTDVKLCDIAELLAGLEASAADVKGVCSEACLHAIGQVDISVDIDEVI